MLCVVCTVQRVVSRYIYIKYKDILIIIIIYDSLGFLVAAKTLQKTEIQREHLVWTVGNGDPMHEVCIPHSIPRVWKQ